MKIQINFAVPLIALALLFGGCSEHVEEYNKPAIYWYNSMINSVSNNNLEKADDYYSSLQSEHVGSPLLPEATMILALSHMQDEEYILSEHFFDEYINRYANQNEKEFAEFMKIKAEYLSLPNARRDQVLVTEAIANGEKFKREYPHSMYLSIINTILTRLYMADAVLNETIASLYDRLDKPKGAQFYRNIKPEPWIDWNEVERSDTPWYKEMFEGDGTPSWYGFMIPDTQSVVSRNPLNKDTNTTK